MSRFIVLTVLIVSVIGAAEAASCFDNWSRCTPATAFGTGILWRSCEHYCQVCRQRETGSCVQVHNAECSGGYQCQCSGGSLPDTSTWLEKQTCALGL